MLFGMKSRNLLIIGVLILLGSGCTPEITAQNKEINEPNIQVAWTKTAIGVERFECVPPECAARIVVYRFPKSGFSWHFQNLTDPLTVAGHLAADSKAVFAVNGVYFDEKNLPTGLLIANGKTVGSKQYEMNKSAIIELAPEFKIINTAKEKFDETNVAEAAQSYPLLIADGVVQKVANEKKARRTFVGEDNQNNIYFGIIPDDEVTLADAAALIVKTGVAWTNVLNLDGGPSSGLASSIPGSTETINSITQVPNAIIAENK
jgi:exopolysaccharide biosynthesis protein